jgi:hypothetical protein
MSKPVTDVTFYLTLREDFDDGTHKLSKGRSFSRTPKEWKKIVKTRMVTIEWDPRHSIQLGVSWFNVEKITHIEQYIIEKIKTIA